MTQVPCDEIAGRVVLGAVGDRQLLTFAGKESPHVRDAPVVDAGFGMFQSPYLRVRRKVFRHVVVDFLLQIDAYGPVRANNFVGTDAGAGGNVAVAGRDCNIRSVIADGGVGPFDCRCVQSTEKSLIRLASARNELGLTYGSD